MSITENLEMIKDELEGDIGEYKILSEIKKSMLLKTNRGEYFELTLDPSKKDGSLILKDVTWIAEAILRRKKKQKYYNKIGFRKGER